MWSPDPILVEVGPLSVRWYGVFFAISHVMGYIIMKKIYQNEGKSCVELDNLLVYMMVGTIVGARLGHCLFYAPHYYINNPIDIFKIWEGGLASHGGAIGIAIALLVYVRKHGSQSFVWQLDRIVIPATLAGSLIRIGNFFNSEIVGVPSNLPWAVIFGRIDMVARHPTQLYESLSYILIFGVLANIYKSEKLRSIDGVLTGSFLVLVFGVRILLENTKEPQAAFTLPLPISVGQLLSIPAVMVGVWLLYRPFSQRLTK